MINSVYRANYIPKTYSYSYKTIKLKVSLDEYYSIMINSVYKADYTPKNDSYSYKAISLYARS